MRTLSIRLKIIGVVIAALLVAIIAVAFVSTRNQRNNLLAQNEKTLATSATMLNHTIRNLMLGGQAPVAVNTLADLQKVRGLEEADIFRTDGSRAFSDYATLEKVNGYLKKAAFARTPRLPDRRPDNGLLGSVLESNVPRRVDLSGPRAMEYYVPILNLPECRKCHGTDHLVRGVAYFRVSTRNVRERIVESNALLAGVFIAAGLFIGLFLAVFLKGAVVSPILEIGDSVNRAAGGDLTARVRVRKKDEIGALGNEINAMISGLEERCRLSKDVSGTADALAKRRDGGAADGRRGELTILFSDIRGFNAFAEKTPPRQAVETLNMILQAQAETVERWGGDVDKFIGDAVMATFADPHKAVQCAYHMIRRVRGIDKRHGTGLRVGIGVGTGEVTRGTIGSANRLEYAAIGDAVNLASRLSGIATADMVLLSERTVDALAGKVMAKLVSGRSIQGKRGTVNFFVLERVYDESARKWVG